MPFFSTLSLILLPSPSLYFSNTPITITVTPDKGLNLDHLVYISVLLIFYQSYKIWIFSGTNQFEKCEENKLNKNHTGVKNRKCSFNTFLVIRYHGYFSLGDQRSFSGSPGLRSNNASLEMCNPLAANFDLYASVALKSLK